MIEIPTPYKLDEWSAREIMGWEYSAHMWAELNDSLAGFRNIIRHQDWQPTNYLGQALRCVSKLGYAYDLATQEDGTASVDMIRRGATESVYEGVYDEHAMALAIMQALYRMWTDGG